MSKTFNTTMTTAGAKVTNRIILITLLLLIRTTIGTDQKFAIEADDVTAVIGSTVILPCRVVGRQGVLQWTKDDFGLGAHRNLSAFDRYTMIGDDDDGDYSLRIDPVELDDEARFQCQVSPGPEGQPGIRSRFTQLTVIVPAEKPTITQGDFILAVQNVATTIECVSVGGKPAATLTWIDGSGMTVTTGISDFEEPLPDDGRRFTSTSVLTINPSIEHHNTTFKCQSHNEADENYKVVEVKIEVQYAADIAMSIVNNDETNGIYEGGEAKFTCSANANPSEVTYKWFINDQLVVGDYATEMIIHNVSRLHHTAVVKCEVTNVVGVSESFLALNVIYPPVFKQYPTSVEADEKEKIHLTCDVDGNPMEIVWVHDPIDRLNYQPSVVGTKRMLNVTVSNETAGRYYCKASVPGYAEIKSEAYVFLKQAPQISSPVQQFGVRGDTLRLECSAFSVPKARHISWSFNGREIDTQTDRDYSVLEDPTARGIKSMLVIRDSKDWHFGRYNCTVVNDYGNDVLQIELLHQNNFQYLMIFVGATSGIVILVIIIMLFLCIRLSGRNKEKQRQKEREFSDDIIPEKNHSSERCWKESDGSSHNSDYKPDIKAGSSESDYSIASTNIADSTLEIKDMRRGGSVPLAGPVDFPINYRHSVDYADGYYPPKYAPPNNNYGYVTHTDYARYCLPPTQKYATQRQLASSSSENNYNVSVSPATAAVAIPGQEVGLPGTRSSLIV